MEINERHQIQMLYMYIHFNLCELVDDIKLLSNHILIEVLSF